MTGATTDPIRTCVGCRTRRPQHELVRCALGPAGAVSVERGAPGRGAWLCIGSRECFEQALKRRGFERAWHEPVQEATLDVLRVTLGMSDVRDQLPELQVVGHRRPAEAMKD